MPTQDEIEQLRERLGAYRRTLATLLGQVAKHTEAYASPAQLGGVAEARAEIAKIKAALRGWGQLVEDHPDDGDQATRGQLGADVLLATLPLDHVPGPAPLPPGSRMPFLRNPLFVGREDDLLALAAALTPRGGAIAIMTGIGGVGKTQLAAEFAHRYGQFFPGGVFWLSFADPAAVDAEIAACGGTGGLALFSATDNLPLDEQVARVRQAWAQPIPRLLIFDNCDDLPTADAAPLLADHLPKTGGCRILVTSRRGHWPRELALDTHALGVLPRAESLALLRSYHADLRDADAEAIAAELGDLPLALTLAGSYLDTYRGEAFGVPAAYLANLRASRLDHRSLQGAGAPISLTAHERSVATTFDLSYQRLDAADSTDALAIAALARVACLAPGEPFLRDLLLAALPASDRPADDEEAAERRANAIRRLLALGLLESATDGALRMHRLIVDFVRARVTDPEALGAIELAVADRSYDLYSKGLPASFGVVQAHLRHLVETAQARWDNRASKLCTAMGRYLRLIGNYAGALPYARRALAICEQTLGPHHPDTATSLGDVARLLQDQGDYAAARPLFERALAIYEQTLGPTHPDTAASLNDLAVLLQDQGDYVTARPLFERALAICEQKLGPSHPDTALGLNNLALLLQAQGDYATARPLFERALAIYEQTLGPSHPDIALSLNNLAGLLHDQGDYAAARPLFERALAIREQTLGQPHPHTAASLNNLAGLLKDQGDYAAARPLFERALAIYEQTLGPSHPEASTSLNNLALLLKDQGDYAGARPLFERALAICEQTLGPSHPDTALGLNNLALLLQAQGDYTAARPLFERALAIYEQVLGPAHPDTARGLNNLALLFKDQGDYAAAHPLFERALAIREHSLGLVHPYTAVSLNNLAALLQDQGHNAAARPLFERALAIREQSLGPVHPHTAASLRNLALLLKEQGDYTAARPLLERDLAICEQALGPEHPDTARSLSNLAALLYAQGDYAVARPLLERVLAICEQALGPAHRDTARSLHNLALLLQAQGDTAAARPLYERALAICEQALGPEHPDTRLVRDNLAALAIDDDTVDK